MRYTRRLAMASLTAALSLGLAGCGGNSNETSALGESLPDPVSRRIILVDDGQPTTSTGDVADTVEVEIFGPGGQLEYGPVRVPLAREMVFEGVPPLAENSTVEIDYLRNGGFLLLRALVNASTNQVSFVNPNEQEVTLNTSSWQFTDVNGSFHLVNDIDGATVEANRNEVQALQSKVPFKIKGVCYSPAVIGTSNKFGSLGDYFWEGFDVGGGQYLLDWEKVWRRDLEDIRPHFNAIRLYSMLAIQQNADGSLPSPNGYRSFTHKRFLDACWNNGKDPIYVLVGIPMSSLCYVPGTAPNAKAEQDWWEANLKATVDEVATHPAVIGFTIFNELGGADAWGGDPTVSTFYWQQIQKYSSLVKQHAPNKLCGFAYFDAPGNVELAKQGMYIQTYGNNLDFFGVNAFQSQVIDPSLKPYLSLQKPVIFTEFGLPGTTHADPSTASGTEPTEAGSLSITETPASLQKTATALSFILPKVLTHPQVAGTFYFEWSDEWWKQESSVFQTSITRWEGGNKTGAPFPNLFNDEEGYGLHSIALNNRPAEAAFSPFNSTAAAGNTQPDILSRRQALWNAVTGAFGNPRQ